MNDELLELLDGLDLPEYIEVINKTTLKIRAGADWEGYKWHTITTKDLVDYRNGDARNISSGIRSLGTIRGDWRPIDGLAHEVDYIFAWLHGQI